MTIGVEWLRRLEPVPPHGDLERGFRQETADPLWLLSRQWQLGEHAGEDAGSPAGVTMSVTHTPIEPLDGMDPQRVPAEAIVEGSAEDWWTVGRRIRVGRRLAGSLTSTQRERAVFGAELPEPYGRAFQGEVDGLQAWRLGFVRADHPALEGFRPRRQDHWDAARLCHDASFRAGRTTLAVEGHTGGDVDWYSADADRPVARPASGPRGPQRSEVVPMRLQYPGAPHPRTWQIEDHHVDVGGFPPDRSHLATALLIELVTDHASDWFLAPVPPPHGTRAAPGVGAVVTLSEVTVRNTFDEVDVLLTPPGHRDPPAGPDEPPGPWSLFRTKGLDRSSLVLWPHAATPLTGPPLDEVAFGVDEDANLMWAVEERLGGVALGTSLEAAEALRQGRATGTRSFTWKPITTLPRHWFPYKAVEVQGRPVFEQGLVGDFATGRPDTALGPECDLIQDVGSHPHRLDLHAVPYQGLRLERRYVLARTTDGRPVLWRQRRTVPLLAPPASHLRFDVLDETPPDP